MQRHGDEEERDLVQRSISSSAWRERRRHGESLGQLIERHAEDRL